MQTIRASIASRLFGTAFGIPVLAEVPKVIVKTVARGEYESSCKALGFGEVISTLACTPNLAVADLIRIASVEVQGVCVGKLHLRFYRNQKKVKRNFVVFDTQVKKLLVGKRDRFSLTMADWMGDVSEEAVQKIAKEACREVERLLTTKPTHTQRSEKSGPVSAVTRSVPAKPQAEMPVSFNSQSLNARTAPAVAQPSTKAPQSAINREAKGLTKQGIVVETGMTQRPGAQGTFQSFCLKLDVNGTHVPFYGVELQRECAERGVVAGQLVEVISMGQQDLGGGRHKNLYRINILRK